MSISPCQICISLQGPSYNDLLQQAKQALLFTNIIEIRLDLLDFFCLNLYQQLQDLLPCTIVWTYRSLSQGGKFTGSPEEKQQRLLSLIQRLKPAFVDIDGDTPPALITELQSLTPFQPKWILSWHDFSFEKHDFAAILDKLCAYKATIYKIAVSISSTIEALRLLHFVKRCNQEKKIPVCGIGMGNLGTITRILAPLVSAPFMYACLQDQPIAPGQLSVTDLRDTYHFDKLHNKTSLFGLIGNPVDKSLSRFSHQKICKHLQHALYLPFYLEEKELASFLEQISFLPIKGLSVTMPFKEKILEKIKSSSLFACNTLKWTSEGVEAYNTDGPAVVKLLEKKNGLRHKVLLLGAGGTARAIAYELHQKKIAFSILNRDKTKAQKLASSFGMQAGGLEEFASFVQNGVSSIVQATSVGMAPYYDQIPVDLTHLCLEHIVALDVIANPSLTSFLIQAKKQGATIISGVEVFIAQAVEQFNIWFGAEIDPSFIEISMRKHLKDHSL